MTIYLLTIYYCACRLELIDDAMLRPGRLGKLLYVPLPTPSDRVGILTALTRKVELAPTTANTTVTGGQEGEGEEGVDIRKIATDPRTDGEYTNNVTIFMDDFQLNFVSICLISRLGFSGADLSALVREAGLAVVKERYHDLSLPNSSSSTFQPVPVISRQQHNMICSRHFEVALNIVRPSVTAEDRIR